MHTQRNVFLRNPILAHPSCPVTRTKCKTNLLLLFDVLAVSAIVLQQMHVMVLGY